MPEERALEITSTLDDMSNLLQRFWEFSKDLMEQFAETGLLTIEAKKDFDNLAFESENIITQAQSLLYSEEEPM